MKVLLRSFFLSLGLSVFAVFGVCQDNISSLTNLRNLLPKAVGEWQRQGDVLEYAGDELFDYINGGAEIYYEYGFVQVIVQDFSVSEEHTLTLEIYEMEDPESAFGIYSFKRSAGGKNVEVGDLGRLEDYYLNFWKGKYLITLTGFDHERITLLGLQAIAIDVDKRMAESGRLPSLVDLLPQSGRIEPSLKYFEGMLGLYNSHSFSQENIFLLNKGIRMDYVSGVSLFLFQYADEEKANTALKKSRAFFEGSSRYSEYGSLAPSRIRVTDSKERLIVVEAFENCLMLVLSAVDLNQAEEWLAEVRANLKNRMALTFPLGFE